MKKRIIGFVLFLLVAHVIKGQDLNFNLVIDKPSCNLVPDGDAEVNIQPPYHPPYTYHWDFGPTTNSVHNIPAGNYTVEITDGLGNDSTVVVEVRASGGTCKVKSELAFTPNGDGFNDVWLLSNIEYYPDNEIVVFNLWGQKVFESHGVYIPWNGNDLAGIPVPDNSYFYIILQDKKNEDTIVRGTISILR